MSSSYHYIDDKIKNLLRTTKVKDVAPKLSSIVSALTEETISEVFQKMITHQIHSLPLYDVKASKYIAFVDIFDILAYVVEISGVPTDPNENMVISADLQTTSCSVLPDLSMRNPWNTLNMEESVQEAINIFSKTGITRIALTDESGKMVSLLTQTRLIKFLVNLTDVGLLANLPLKSLGFGNSPVIGIKETEPTINAFLKIYQFNIGGLAVFDNKNCVVGNISITDLKDIGFTFDMFQKMFIPARDFIQKKVEGKYVPKLIAVTKEDPIQTIFDKFRSYPIHRIYILDKESNEPVGVISTSDIICLFNSTDPHMVYLEHLPEHISARRDSERIRKKELVDENKIETI